MNSSSNNISVKNSEAIQQGYIQVPGGRIWYKVVGKVKKGIPVLVIHGGPGASHDYLESLEVLAEERPVIFYDQLGCGHSENPEDISLWSVERFVEELDYIIKALDLERVHLIGQSWGTSLAVDYFLTKKPREVVSMVLSAPLLSTTRWIEDQKIHISELPQHTQNIIHKCEENKEFTTPEYQEAMMEFYNIHVCRLNVWPECLNRSFEKLNYPMYEYMWGPSEFTVTGVLKNYERIDRLKEITIPVLFTCGQYDEASPATVKVYKEHLPGSRIYVFEDASHEHHIEKLEEYLRVVKEFIKSVEQ